MRYFSQRRCALFVAGILLLIVGHAWGHDNAYLDTIVGPHGGQLRMAGRYHLELVIDPPVGTRPRVHPVTIYLTDHAGRPIASKGFRARAVVLANGRRIAISLQPDGRNRLTGEGVFAHDPYMIVSLRLLAPDRVRKRVRFAPYRHFDGSSRDVVTLDSASPTHAHRHPTPAHPPKGVGEADPAPAAGHAHRHQTSAHPAGTAATSGTTAYAPHAHRHPAPAHPPKSTESTLSANPVVIVPTGEYAPPETYAPPPLFAPSASPETSMGDPDRWMNWEDRGFWQDEEM